LRIEEDDQKEGVEKQINFCKRGQVKDCSGKVMPCHDWCVSEVYTNI